MAPPAKVTPKRIPIGITRQPPPSRSVSADGLLLVGHGSRCLRSEQETQALGGLAAAALPDVTVGVGFLEMTDPSAGRVLDALVESGCRRIRVLPLVLLDAGHAKSDVPAVVLEGRRRHPGVEVILGSPLGVTRVPVEVLGRSVELAGGAGLPLLVVARGTSDPDANAEAHKAARLIAEWTGAPFHHVGFSGVTTPLVPEAAGVFARLGYRRIAVAWWYLCHGKLIEQGRADLAEFARGTGIEVLDAGHIGPHPALAPVIAARYAEAGAVPGNSSCDLCAYRAAWPGLEDRVAQPRGVGHSHLAVEHRRSEVLDH
jgi:sirohydrochlorin cobaltochelatase